MLYRFCYENYLQSLMYKKVIDIQYRNSLANELMMFHMKVKVINGVEALALCQHDCIRSDFVCHSTGAPFVCLCGENSSATFFPHCSLCAIAVFLKINLVFFYTLSS